VIESLSSWFLETPMLELYRRGGCFRRRRVLAKQCPEKCVEENPRRRREDPGVRRPGLRADEGEGLGACRQRFEAMAAAEYREVGPVMGVGAPSCRRVVGGREAMLDGSSELGEDRCRPRAARSQPARVRRTVFGDRADLGAVRGRIDALFFHRESSRPLRLRNVSMGLRPPVFTRLEFRVG